MNELKLSQLNNSVEISKEGSNSVYTVGELKREIQELGEEDHFIGQWFTIVRRRWKPDAQYMIDCYIENESDNMYDDWGDRANDCLDETVIANLQAILDEAFAGDHATEYWEYDQFVEIDMPLKQKRRFKKIKENGI